MKRVLILNSLLIFMALTTVAGCTSLVLWNPLYKGAELDERISFNIENVGIRIDKFGFWNSSFSPTAHVEVKNFSDIQVIFDFEQCVLHLGAKSIVAEPILEPRVTLNPGQSAKRTVRFEASLEHGPPQVTHGKKHYIPQPSQAELQLGFLQIGTREVSIPSVEYVYAYRNFKRTQFP